MKDFHAETYIVYLEHREGKTVARIERNDGQWYDEIFTEIATELGLSQMDEVIELDFKERADEHDRG